MQGVHWEFGIAGAACSIAESSGGQNLHVSIVVLKASKYVGAKGDVPKIYGCTLCTHAKAFPGMFFRVE